MSSLGNDPDSDGAERSLQGPSVSGAQDVWRSNRAGHRKPSDQHLESSPPPRDPLKRLEALDRLALMVQEVGDALNKPILNSERTAGWDEVSRDAAVEIFGEMAQGVEKARQEDGCHDGGLLLYQFELLRIPTLPSETVLEILDISEFIWAEVA